MISNISYFFHYISNNWKLSNYLKISRLEYILVNAYLKNQKFEVCHDTHHCKFNDKCNNLSCSYLHENIISPKAYEKILKYIYTDVNIEVYLLYCFNIINDYIYLLNIDHEVNYDIDYSLSYKAFNINGDKSSIFDLLNILNNEIYYKYKYKLNGKVNIYDGLSVDLNKYNTLHSKIYYKYRILLNLCNIIITFNSINNKLLDDNKSKNNVKKWCDIMDEEDEMSE